MPFKSEAQRRLFHAKAERGEISEKKVREWEHKTKNKKDLPYHVKKSASSILDDFLAKTGANLAKGIGVLTAGKGGPKALERVVSAEKPNKPVSKPATNEAIEWRKPDEPKKPVEELLKFFSLKEGMMGNPVGRGFSAGATGAPSIGVGANKPPSMAMVPKGSGVGGLATGNASSAGEGRTGTAAVDPEILQAALMKADAAPAANKLWQGLTGLSDDVLMAAMNIQKKREQASKKASADEFVSSLSMLTKMSEVSKKEVADFFRHHPNPKDEKLHTWAEGRGDEPDKVEAKAYQLATERVGGGKHGPDRIQGGKADGKPVSDYDPHEIAMGRKVEQEHTNDAQLAEEIAKDHLEEIPDYYTRLKRMEDAAPKKEAGILQENPLAASYPVSLPAVPVLPPTDLPPDVIQLLKAQALIDQAKTAQNYDPGDVRIPYPREDESGGVAMPMDDIQEQMFYDQMLAQQMRAQNIEDEFKSKVRKGQIIGGLTGLAGGAGIGHLLGAGGKMHIPAMLLGGGAGGFLGASLGENVGRKQGLEYLQNYTGIPWRMQ